MHPATILIWIISFISIVCMLIRPRGIAEAYWACGGAILLCVCRLLPLPKAGHAVYEGVDVYLFLTGMMILAELAREEGVFDWVAGIAARNARGSPERLFLLIYLSGTIITALLSNDATAVVLTPAVLAVVRKAKVEPKPYLLACAFIANAASFVFPISNPANLVIFDQHMPSLGRWLSIFILPSIASVVVTFICLRLLSRRDLEGAIAGNLERAELSTNGKLALAGLLLAAAALIASSALGLSLGAPTCGAAVVALLIVFWRDRGILLKVAKGVSWAVLPLVAGLFVIVEALKGAGMLHLGLAGLQALAHTSNMLANLAAAFAVGLLSNGMNNLPVGLIGGATVQAAHETGSIANAVLIGVDLGPNLSVTGSLATILWLIALRREQVEITAWQFLKVGLVAMPLALLASILLLFK
ncbi:MAG: arsenic transporter [Acidobacteriaceae bacterium]